VRDIQIITKNWPEKKSVKVKEVIKSGETVSEQFERRGLPSRYQRILLSLEIYQGTARGQLPEPHFY